MRTRRPPGGGGVSHAVPGGSRSAGFVAVALSDSEVSAIAYLTVATELVPSRLVVSTRSGSGRFSAPATVATTRFASDLHLAVGPDGALTLIWSEGGTIRAGHRASTGNWVTGSLSSGASTAWLPDLAFNESGQALAVWQEGIGYQPTSIHAARMAADGTWSAAERVSPVTGHATWNPKPGLDGAGDAVVGWLDASTMVVARAPAAGSWQAPEALSGSQSVYYPALSMDAAGDVVAAWQALDSSNTGSIWARWSPAGGGWGAAARLSARAEDTAWPSASYARSGALAAVGWTDDATNQARVAILRAGTWRPSTLGDGWWMGVVPVATGSVGAVAGWARPHGFNPNAADLLSSDTR